MPIRRTQLTSSLFTVQRASDGSNIDVISQDNTDRNSTGGLGEMDSPEHIQDAHPLEGPRWDSFDDFLDALPRQ